MAKHQSIKNKLREQEFKKKMFESLKASYQNGLLVGSRAMLKVIGDMISKDDEKTPEEKLADVMKYINNSLEMTKKTAQEADQRVAEANKPIEELGEDNDAEDDETAAEEGQEEDEK